MGEFVWIDCLKAREAASAWREAKGLQWKSFGFGTNQLQRILGKSKKSPSEVARIERSTMVAFSKTCGRPLEDFLISEENFLERKLANRLSKSRSAEPQIEESKRQDQEPVSETTTITRDTLGGLQRRLSGFHEVFHYATTENRLQTVSIFLLHVRNLNRKAGTIECTIHDHNSERPYFHHHGRVTAVGDFLHWEFTPESQNAIVLCCSHWPRGEKFVGAKLGGIFLSTLSGVPLSAKVVMRFIGETPEEALQNSVVVLPDAKLDAQTALTTNLGGYLPGLQAKGRLKKGAFDRIKKEIVPLIDNRIAANAAPLALWIKQCD